MKILCNNIVNPKNCILSNTPFTIERDKVFVAKDDDNHKDNIVVENSIAFPGLINIHDHLKYSWHKRIGKGEKIEENQQKYENVYQWLGDLYKVLDSVFDSANNGLDITFQLGLYKQIFSATTTVLNHSRHSSNVLHSKNQHINIVENIESELLVQLELVSNVTSHSLSFGKNFNKDSQKPFMIHVAEGVDIHTKKEINILNQRGWLTPQTILVHCINTDNKDLELIVQNKCSIVWCPYTSDFVIGKIANIQKIISKGINLCIGTDSSCSGSKNLLAELNYARELYHKNFHTEISSADLFDMVTINPAKALMLENEIGKIENGFNADIAIIDKQTENSYDDILSCNPQNIIALFCKGTFIFGDKTFYEKIPNKANKKYSEFRINEREKIIIGNPKRLLQSFVETFKIKETVLFDFIPRELQIKN